MSEEVRVLHIISTLVSGGVQSVVLNYAAAVKPYGVVFDYVVQGKGNPEIEQACLKSGSRIYYLPQMTKHPIRFIFELRKLLRVHREYRILHTHHNFLNFIPLFSAFLTKTPVRISHSHMAVKKGTKFKSAIRAMGRWLILRLGNEFWACSKEAWFSLYGRLSQKAYILHNSVDKEIYMFKDNERNEYRRNVGVNTTDFVCICVATLSERKNQTFLIEIIKELPSFFKLLLVGDGAIRPQLIDFAKEIGVDDRVLFLGDRDDVPALLSAADCFVLASKAEGLGLAAVEAEVNGLPCVISDCVPREVAFTEQVWFESIGENGIPAWKNRLLQIESENYKHSSPPRDVIASSGYDISVEGRKLAHKYKELFER